MPNLYRLIHRVLSGLPREAAHELSLRALELGASGFLGASVAAEPDPPTLRQHLWGLDFANPVGLAAGYDKDARVPDAILGLGFGFVEVGTVTPCPQPGNPKPRLFTLEKDQAVVNRMGFNSGGLDAVCDRLSRRARSGIVGLNLGKNRDSEDAAADYTEGIRRAARLADYLVVNVSSPNTPGLRELQRRAALASLLERLIEVREETGCRVPLLVKIAPDLTFEECRDIAHVALETGIDGLIVSNTTIARPPGLASRHALGGGTERAPFVRGLDRASRRDVSADPRAPATDRRRRNRECRGCLHQDPRGRQPDPALYRSRLCRPRPRRPDQLGARELAGARRLRLDRKSGRNRARRRAGQGSGG